ncbi:MAG: VWA domain-containing protein [Acidobacteria bacterium]|nr:VWA domain-containing protein [Acidobacteriota bacterium]
MRRVHDHRRFQEAYLRAFVALSICCLLCAGCGQIPPERQAGITIEIKRPQTKLGVDLFLCLDESGSMLTTDPERLRHEAGKYLIQNLLVKDADPKFPHRIAVIPFDDRAYGGDLIDLHPAKATEVAAQLTMHPPTRQGNTSFIEALRRAQRSLDEAQPYPKPRRTVIVIFTDGEPDDARKLSLGAYFDELRTYLRDSFPDASLYIIGIDQTPDRSRFGRTVAAWRDLSGEDHVILMERLDDLYSRFNDTVRKIFELPESPTDILAAREERSFEAMPYLSRMEIHAFSERELRLRLLRPDGSLVESGQQGIEIREQPGYRIITIKDPMSGLWRYQTEGEGQVKVFRNEVPFRMTLLSPEPVHPMGKPIRLKAEFVTETGEPIRQLPEFPLKFTARIVNPDRTEETRTQFLERVGTVYYADRETPTSKPGDYTIEIEIHGGQKLTTKYTELVEVREFAYLTLNAPRLLARYGFGDELEIAGQLHRATVLADPEKEFQTNPNSLILAQLISSPGGQKSGALWLDYDPADKSFHGRLPFQMRAPGAYTLAVQLKGEPRLPSVYTPAAQIEATDFYVNRDWRDSLWLGARIVLVLLILWLVSVAIWLLTRKKYIGTLEVRDDQGTEININNRRFILPPRPVEITQDEQRKIRGKLWLVATGPQSVKVVWGGWPSVMFFGLSNSCQINQDDGEPVRVGRVDVMLS